MASPDSDLEDTAEVKGGLSPFLHQVAGHSRLLLLNQTTLCKPLIQRELHFYLNTPPDMKPFTPTYKGVIRVKSVDRNLSAAAGPDPSTQKVRYFFPEDEVSFRTDHHNPDDSRPMQKHFLLLENIASSYKRPCILDLKMGTQQHGDHAPADKRNRQKAKCAASTSGTLGVRLCGMQVYQVDTNSFYIRDKYYGRTLTEEGLLRVLQQFFHNGVTLRTAVLARVLDKVGALRRAVQRQDSFRFYSSSLLITYEGSPEDSDLDFESEGGRPRLSSGEEEEDGSSLDSSGGADDFAKSAVAQAAAADGGGQVTPSSPNPSRVDVRMIDFAHTTYEGYQGDTLVHSGPDKGYLFGLDNLVKLLTEVLIKNS